MKIPVTLALLTFLLLSPITGNGQDELLIGLIPEENIFKQMERHRPLAAYLSERLGIRVKLTILSKYGDIIDKFVSRRMDGAFFEVFTGVLAMEKLSVEPIARPVNLSGSAEVQSYVFVRRDSGIRDVRDMKGKRMAFVDRATVTGYLFAVSYLKEQGIRNVEGYFKEHYFTGSHDSAVYAVLDNRADIGTADSKTFQRMVEKDPSIRTELVIVAQSPAFPETTLCLRNDFPPDVKAKIRNLLLAMDRDPEGREVLTSMKVAKFIPAGRDDFVPFTEMARKAGINLKTYRYK